MKVLQHILVLITTVLFTGTCPAQLTFEWAGRMGGNSISSAPSDVGRSIALDKDGNVYTTGNFYGTADFDPSGVTRSLTSSGASDVFVSKLTSAGTYVWAKKMGGSNYNDGNDIAVDKNGYVYIIGSFQSVTDFDPGPDVHSLTPLGYRDVFVCKLDSNGNYIWAKQFGGAVISTDQCDGYGIAVDDDGNVYTTGAILYGKADFDPGPGIATLISAGEFDIFICKLNSNGDFEWAKSMGSTWREAGNKIAVDAKGYVYVTGYFSGTVDFDPGAGTRNLSTPLYSNDAFICRFDSTGALSWAHKIGAASGNDEGEDIAVDAAGNIYTTGNFYYGGADFDPGPDTFALTSISSSDMFICKWDSSAKFCWAKNIGGASATIHAYAIAISNNTVCVTGNFGGRAGVPFDFDPGPGIYNLYSNPGTNNTSVNIFVEQLDTAGQFLHCARLGGPTGIVTNTGFGIATDNSGNVYTTGQYVSTADFDPDSIGTYYLTTTNALDDEEIFISKLHSNSTPVVLPVAGFSTIDTAFCTNSCISFTNHSSNATTWQWHFTGAVPATDTSENPKNICYATSGTYDVTLIASNTNGSDTFTITNYIRYYQAVAATITIPGADTIFCASDSVQLCATGSFRSLQWNNGDTAKCTYAKNAGGYWANTVDTNGCAAQSNRKQLLVHPIPVVAISLNQDTLSSFGASSYQWYLDGEIIEGATAEIYKAQQAGYYHVAITDSNGCSATSSQVYYLITSMADNYHSLVNTYPNPNTNGVWVLQTGDELAGSNVEVLDAMGRLVWNDVITKNRTRIQLTVPEGIYLLRIRSGGKVYHARLVKQ